MQVNRPDVAWFLEDRYDIVVPNGKQAKVCCPFHEEKRASMAVYRDSERVVCYAGCFDGRAVDVIDILQEVDGLSFQDAVEQCKDWPGTLVESDGSSAASRGRRERRRKFSFTILEG